MMKIWCLTCVNGLFSVLLMCALMFNNIHVVQSVVCKEATRMRLSGLPLQVCY